MLPGTRPMLLETFAITGAKPNARRVGNVISDPGPTTALMAPAAIAAASIATISPLPTRPPAHGPILGWRSACLSARSARRHGAGRPARARALDDQRHSEAAREGLLGEHVAD